MTDKIVLNKALGTYDVIQINNNFDKIAKALNEQVFYRDNPSGTVNTVKTPVDMNGQRLFNLPAPVLPTEPARKADVVPQDVVDASLASMALSKQTAIDAAATATAQATIATTKAGEALVSANNAANAQLQADWNQSNTTSKDYIKNKPSLASKLDTSAVGAASGVVGLDATRRVLLPNNAGTFSSLMTNTNTAARTYTLPDKDGTVAMTSDISSALVLVAQTTLASAGPSFNFLSAFTSAYDKYIIELLNYQVVSQSDQIVFRVASSGVAQTGTNYSNLVNPNSTVTPATASNFTLSTMHDNSVIQAGLTFEVTNCNSTGLHTVSVRGMAYTSTANAQHINQFGLYSNSVQLSGFTMSLLSGNFARGTVRVYGVRNT